MRVMPSWVIILLSVAASALVEDLLRPDEKIAKLTEEFLIQRSTDALIEACNRAAENEGFAERFSRKDMPTAYIRSANLRPPEHASVIAIKHGTVGCNWTGDGRANAGALSGEDDDY